MKRPFQRVKTPTGVIMPLVISFSGFSEIPDPLHRPPHTPSRTLGLVLRGIDEDGASALRDTSTLQRQVLDD